MASSCAPEASEASPSRQRHQRRQRHQGDARATGSARQRQHPGSTTRDHPTRLPPPRSGMWESGKVLLPKHQ